MRDDRVLRVLRPALALLALAALLVVLGLAITGPARAATKSPTPKATKTAKVKHTKTPSPSATADDGAHVLQRGVASAGRRGRHRGQGHHRPVGRGVRRRRDRRTAA